jgi:hypothetical protein
MSAYEDDDYPDDWTLTTHLLCADPISGQQVVSNYTLTDSNEPKGVDASCPGTQNATGGSALAVSMNPSTQSELIVNSAFTLSACGGNPQRLSSRRLRGGRHPRQLVPDGLGTVRVRAPACPGAGLSRSRQSVIGIGY